MAALIPFLTSLLTLASTALVLYRTARQDRVLANQTQDLATLKDSVNGELQAVQDRAAVLQARAEATAVYAKEMQVYAGSLRRSLAIIAKAEQAGELVVSLRETVHAQIVREPLQVDEPCMLDP